MAIEQEYSIDEAMKPQYRVADSSQDGMECKKLYIQTFYQNEPNTWLSDPPEEWHHLASIYNNKIEMWPIFTAVYTQRYHKPRHGRFEKLIVEHREIDILPSSPDDIAFHIQQELPHRLFNDCDWGLGLVKELDGFIGALHQLPSLNTLVISESGDPKLDGTTLHLSAATLAGFLRKFERVNRLARQQVRTVRNYIVRNDLLPQIDSDRFPRIEEIPTGTLVEYRQVRKNPTAAQAKLARRTSVKRVKENLTQLAAEEPRELLQLHAEIERVTLARMIERFEQMMRQNLPEPRWQKFFEENIFILSILFTRPVYLLHTQFHAQGSLLTGRGAQVGDFLFTERGQALAIVEIKRPSSEITAGTPYRNTEVYGPSTDLAGAITQVLHQQNAMRVNWHSHRNTDEGLSESGSDSIRCFVIAGTYPTENARKRSFELFRNSSKDVEVITFDELLAKLRLLQQHLSVSPPEKQPESPFG